MKITKKKGRPSKSPLPLSTPPTSNRRSSRRNPNNHSPPPPPPDFDDDDERKDKKVKLVVRLPQSDENNKVEDNRHSREIDSGSGSGSGFESEPDSGDREGSAKKRKINGGDDRGSGDGASDQGRHWSLVPQLLCRIRRRWYSFSTGSRKRTLTGYSLNMWIPMSCLIILK